MHKTKNSGFAGEAKAPDTEHAVKSAVDEMMNYKKLIHMSVVLNNAGIRRRICPPADCSSVTKFITNAFATFVPGPALYVAHDYA